MPKKARIRVEVPAGEDEYRDAVYKPMSLHMSWNAHITNGEDGGTVIVVEVAAEDAERLRDAYLESGCRVGPIEQVAG